MTYKQAKKRAQEYNDKNPTQATFVFRSDRGFDWCTENQYYYTSHQDVKPEEVVWHSEEGEYHHAPVF